jgi:hypothetical protein
VLKQIGQIALFQSSEARDPQSKLDDRKFVADSLKALAQALQALPTKLSEAQASHALEPLLNLIGQTTDPVVVQRLFVQTTDSGALVVFAQALQALTAKLTESQAAQASEAAAASLAWAADNDEAAEWARALVALSGRAADRDGALVKAIAYPTAAGSATEVLLDALRAGHPDAPPRDKGTESALKWLTEKFPHVLTPPVCPPPVQSEPDLKCPLQEAAPAGQ